MPSPLSGIRVLDLTRVLAGPFCTMTLGDMGAEVIKVEEPVSGDDTRRFGPPFVNGVSTYFLSLNRNKKSIAVDLKHPQGASLVRKIASKCDVVAENFRPGVAARLGFGHQALRADNPRLIYCSISGFGHAGLAEHSQRSGYDIVVQGLSGLQDLTGEPAGPPTKAGVPIADLLTGMTAMQAIVLALYVREKTGIGQFLDIAMLDSTAQVLTFQAASYLVAGVNPARLGNRHPSIAPYELYEARDGFFNLAVGNDALFAKLCALLDKRLLVNDPRFSKNHLRVENRAALAEQLTPIFRTKSLAHWLTAFDREGIPAGPIYDVAHAVTHPQLQARGMVANCNHSIVGNLRLIGTPLRLEGVDFSAQVRPPPKLGEHTRETLTDLLGLERSEIGRLAQQGAINLGEDDTEPGSAPG